MKKSFIPMLVALTTMIVSFAGCDKDDTPVVSKPDAVVAVFKNGNIDYWRQIATTVTSECEQRGTKPIISYVNDDSDADGQLAIVAGLQKLQSYYNIKGVIGAPIFTGDDHRVESALAEFAGSDIPVVIIDSPVDENASPLKDIYKAYVGTDNAAAGRQLAKACGISDVSSILAARVAVSTPTVDRYNGFCEEMKNSVPVWETADIETPENLKAQLDKHPGVTNLVFFNGNLCNSVKAAFEDVDVYTFDVYEQFLLDLKNPATSPIKGVMAQNTFEMGRKAVEAVFSTVTEKNVYIPTIYITSENLFSSEVKPFLNYYNIREEAKGTILVLLGSESEFWNRVAEGAIAGAEKNNLNVEVVFREGETEFQSLLEAISKLESYKNLKGIVMAENDMTIDAALAAKNPKVPVVAIEALPSVASPLSFSSCVVADNFEMGKEIARRAGGKNVLVMSYDDGGSLDRSEGVFVYLEGNVGRIKSTGSIAAEDDLRTFLAGKPGFYDTAIITTGNFVTDGIMSQLSGMNVFTVDINANARKYIRSGAITFTADTDLYEMGFKAIECVSNDISGYHIHNVPVNYITESDL